MQTYNETDHGDAMNTNFGKSKTQQIMVML